MALDPAETAETYREGFVAGARAILGGIGDDLPEEQKRVLEKWIDGTLETWRHAGPDAAEPIMPMIDGG